MGKERVKLGLVGCGYVADGDYFPALARPVLKERVELVAVCSPRADHVAAVRDQQGAREAYTDYGEMLARAEVEAVALLTPINLHYEQAAMALEAGKDVYVQKTMTVTTAEADDLIAGARRAGRVLAAAPGQMLSPHHQVARRLLEAGTIGKVCYVRGRGGHSGYEHQTNPGWRYKRGGGPMRNTGVYPLHSLTGLIGPVRRVSAFSAIAVPVRYWNGQAIEVEEDDNTVLNLDFGNGCFGQVDSSYHIRRQDTPQLEIYGSDGVLCLGGWYQPDRPLRVYTSREEVPGLVRDASGWFSLPPDFPTPDPLIKHTGLDLLHFAEWVRGEVEPVATAEHARHVIEVIERGYQAAATGVTQEVKSDLA